MFSPCLSDVSQIPEKIEKISRFPIVNLNSRNENYALIEPYVLLRRPGGILIDENGIICKLFLRKMTFQDFKESLITEAWRRQIKVPPQNTSKEVLKEICK